MRMDDTSRLDGQPMGFAEPVAPPLGAYTTFTLTGIVNAPIATPDSFTAASDPGPQLEQIAPAPPDSRNPTTPFEAGQNDQMPDLVQRDPRKPIVTSSFSGNDNSTDFAPPTGVPVVPDAKAGVVKWAAPTGQPAPWGAPMVAVPVPMPRAANPGAIARVGAAAPWTMPPTGAPPGVVRAPGPYPPGIRPAPGAYPPGVVPAPRPIDKTEAQMRARFAAATDGVAKFGVVMQAVPWYVLPILALGAFFATGWSVLLLCLAWIICGSSAKVAKTLMSRCFLITGGIYMFSWIVLAASGASGTEELIVRICCGALVAILPTVAWRELEKPR